MGAGSSKPGEEGIITVHANSSAVPASQGTSTAAASSSGEATAEAASSTEALLLHLKELQAKAPSLEAAAGSSSSKAAAAAVAAAASPAAAAAEPESLLNDIQAVKQLSSDTGRLNTAIHTLLTSYQAWHNDNVKLVVTNQEYLARTIVQAETKADQAVRHVQLQTNRLKTLSSGLADAAALPALLADITASTAALQEQLQQLEDLAAQQQQQQNLAAAASAASSSSASGLFRRSKSPAPKQQQQQQQQGVKQQQQEQEPQQQQGKQQVDQQQQQQEDKRQEER
jgi:hypothetical protein